LIIHIIARERKKVKKKTFLFRKIFGRRNPDFGQVLSKTGNFKKQKNELEKGEICSFFTKLRFSS